VVASKPAGKSPEVSNATEQRSRWKVEKGDGWLTDLGIEQYSDTSRV